MDKKPEWRYKTPKKVVEWFIKNNAHTVTHHYEFEMDGQQRQWVYFVAEDKHTKSTSPKLKREYFGGLFGEKTLKFVFDSNHGMIEVDKRVIDLYTDIKLWEEKHEKEYEEYLRLKLKFGGE